MIGWDHRRSLHALRHQCIHHFSILTCPLICGPFTALLGETRTSDWWGTLSLALNHGQTFRWKMRKGGEKFDISKLGELCGEVFPWFLWICLISCIAQVGARFHQMLSKQSHLETRQIQSTIHKHRLPRAAVALCDQFWIKIVNEPILNFAVAK